MKDTCTEYLRYDYTRDEVLEMGQELARKSNELAEAETRKKAVVAQLKQESDQATSHIATLSRQISNGYEYRNVECKILWHTPRVGMATIVRTDTGEVTKERQMTDAERQALLPFEETQAEETTVSLQMTGPNGETISTPPIPVADFVASCEAISAMPDDELRAYFREHLNDDPLVWPAGATEEQCERILAELKQAVN